MCLSSLGGWWVHYPPPRSYLSTAHHAAISLSSSHHSSLVMPLMRCSSTSSSRVYIRLECSRLKIESLVHPIRAPIATWVRPSRALMILYRCPLSLCSYRNLRAVRGFLGLFIVRVIVSTFLLYTTSVSDCSSLYFADRSGCARRCLALHSSERTIWDPFLFNSFCTFLYFFCAA